ncbi:MAG: divergent polysaccharide deacetylase family protein [Nitrospirae bacterium]|nr:divergent polysaccharide deacetylase family protein [Nitrospirota bacterium]
MLAGIVIGLASIAADHFLKRIHRLELLQRENSVKRESAPLLKPEIRPGDRIAVLIDDLGTNFKEFERLRRIDSHLSFAILPFQPYSVKIAKKAHYYHQDVLLHLPMEPENHHHPGKGAIDHLMTKEEIVRQVRLDLRAFPYVQGVNNHMGSRMTADREEMVLVLKEVRAKDLFFVDSRTTSESIAYEVAHDIGIKSAERHVFLDDSDRPEDIRKELRRLVYLSHQRGSAIAIGHPRPNTMKALEEFIPHLHEEEIELVPISALVK